MKIFQSLTSITATAHGLSASLDWGWLLHVRAVEDGLLRVVIEPDTGLPDPRTWTIAPDGDVPWEGRDRNDLTGFNAGTVSCEIQDGGAVLSSPLFRIRLQSSPVRLTVEQKVAGHWRPWIEDRSTGGFALTEKGQRVRHFQYRDFSDRHFGLGDKSGPVDRTGRRYRVLQLDALGYDAEVGDPLYKHIPYIAVQKGAVVGGLFYDSLAPSTFDLGCERSNYHGIYRYVEIEERGLDLWLIAGPSLAEVTQRFTMLTGRPALSPRWSYGFAFTTMHHADDANAQAVIGDFADRCRSERIPISAIHFGSGYSSRGKRRYVFTWNTAKFPDAKGLFSKLAGMGLPAVANLKPVLIDDHVDYAKIARAGGFIRDEFDKPVLEQFWDGMGSYLDFTNAETVKWWQERFKAQVLDFGFTAGWNDNNEYEVGRDNSVAAGFGKPLNAPSVRPLHALLMTRATFESSKKYSPAKRPYTITRAGPAGIQRYGETWTGDNLTSWHTLKWNVCNGLSLALSGQSKVGHDIGGFTGPRPDPELLCRWIEMMALHPRAVMNSWKPEVAPDWQAATTPWLYPEIVPAIRNALNLRTAFLPLMYAQGYRAHQSGAPIIRPLFYDFPDDQSAYEESSALMLGPDVLFAPVVEAGALRRTQYLPAGPRAWIEFHTGAVFSAGAAATVDAPLGRPPVFIRAGSALVLASELPFISPHDAPARRIYLATASDTENGQGYHFEDDGESWAYVAERFDSSLAFTLVDGHATITISAQTGAYEAMRDASWIVDGPFVKSHTIKVIAAT